MSIQRVMKDLGTMRSFRRTHSFSSFHHSRYGWERYL